MHGIWFFDAFHLLRFFSPEGKDTLAAITGNYVGINVLGGLAVCVLGIIVCGKAGTMKERNELSTEGRQKDSKIRTAEGSTWKLKDLNTDGRH